MSTPAPLRAPPASRSIRATAREKALLKTGALQNAILNSANFSSIATDDKGVIQLFNVGAERMLGYSAAEVIDQITPADISDPQEVIARAAALSLELGTAITPGFETLAFKASRGIEDIYELTYIRKDGTRFPAIVSVTALRDAALNVIGRGLAPGARLGRGAAFALRAARTHFAGNVTGLYSGRSLMSDNLSDELIARGLHC